MKIFFIGLNIFLVIACCVFVYYTSKSELRKQYFELEIPEKRSYEQTIAAIGILQIKDLVKVGSYIDGTLKNLYVEENQTVEKGQLLAEIDTGKSNIDIKEAQGLYDQSIAELEFQQKEYDRQKYLYEQGMISVATFQHEEKELKVAACKSDIFQARLEKAIQEYNHTRIYAPISGMIVEVGVVQGERISTYDRGTLLFKIAPDIKKMEADLVIDEKDLGRIKLDQGVRIFIETFPNKIFESKIHKIRFLPKEKEDVRSYHVIANLDNSNLFLRPGMTLNAFIDIASVKDTLSLTSLAFLIKEDTLKHTAEMLKIAIASLSSKEKAKIQSEHSGANIQFVWTVCNDCFQEIAVEIGSTNGIYYEVINGIEENTPVVIEVLENDKMKDVIQKWYK